ncbi:MAG: glutamate--tRNA ligase [Candidatus Hydrogenedentota bacterium]|nr:MAG: glutamate--tRNA ligase [Candidatus Hydrogenedentota bacterium]
MTEGRVRTRFAPSPTGYLHVGGARTALFSWAFARHCGGEFILRIEDTDAVRSDPTLATAIVEAMEWLGLDWDEGPLYQSERREMHDDLIRKLLETGRAYECFCTAEELEARRAATGRSGIGYRYEGTCRGLTEEQREAFRAAGRTSVVRLDARGDEEIEVEDVLRGTVRFEAGIIDDFIIRKSDGTPTFHFAVAADDALMGITHVIRGDDHLSNTPKQIRVIEALAEATGRSCFRLPVFVHLPLIVGPDGKRFSKRHGATSVSEFRKRGFLSEALFNYLALLGWSPGDDREVMSREEIVEAFTLERLNKSAAVFDEQKLRWLNGQYIAKVPLNEVLEFLGDWKAEYGLTEERLKEWGVPLSPDEFVERVASLGKDRAKVLEEIAEIVRYFLIEEIEIEEAAAKKHFRGERLIERLRLVRSVLEEVEPWSEEALETAIRSAAEKHGFKAPKLMHPTRVAVTGRAASPGLFETVFLVGRRRAIRRMDRVLEERLLEKTTPVGGAVS